MTILDMSLGGGLLIAAILVLRRGLLNRLPKWTFLLLWAVALCRLLAPVTLPSQLSIFNGAAWLTEAVQPAEELPAAPTEWQDLVVLPPVTVPGTFREDSPILPAVPAPPAPEKEPVSPLTAVYLTGAALCGLFFAAAYLWGLRRFHEAEPADCPFITRWREEHPTLFPVEIKTCAAVNAPLAYGLVWPVILLPEHTDWSDEGQLTYILTHEYVHIRRGDLFWKLLLTAALCVHWFNPLVWVMYFQANRDLELACDERVVRKLGLDNRKNYAYALLAAAESGFMPFCTTYKSKNHMEERIRAIMKMKKTSLAAVITAVLLVVGVTAVFATSKAPEPKKIDDLPPAVMTNTDPKPSGSVSVPAPVEKDKPTAIDRVHPVTGTPVQPSETDAQEPDAASSQDQVLFPDAMTPNAANFWGFPEGRIEKNIEYFARNEEEFKEMIRQLRIKGYDGYFEGIGHYPDGRCSVVLSEDFDGVAREISVPEGFMPDWTYPVNTKGETYGKRGMSGRVGYDPDLIGVVATNGQTGYMQINYGYTGETNTPEGWKAYQAWLSEKPNPWKVPVYDVNRDNIIGYFEVGHQTSSETQAKIDELKGQENRWNVPADPIPEGTEFQVANMEEANELCQYLHNVCGIDSGDLAYIGSGPVTVRVDYLTTKQKEEAKVRLANGYPVNSKGETYGNSIDQEIMGYVPDLVGVVATDTKAHGYALKDDFEYFDMFAWAEKNNKKSTTREDVLKLMEDFKVWASTQPSVKEIPVYDVDRNNILGYFKIYNDDGYDYTISQEEIEWRLNALADKMREWGNSEEQIARELEEYKASQGWS